MPFKPLAQPRQRLADQVYGQIMEAIRSGEIGADERIVQEKLAEEFAISRTPIREALFRMQQEGILELTEGGYFVIRTLSERQIRELYGARCALEGFAARMLAAAPDPARDARLRALISEVERGSYSTSNAYFEANRAIHRAFVEAAENEYLLEFFDNIWNRGYGYTMFATIEDVDLSKSLGDHLALVDAIATGDPEAAQQRMNSHILDGCELNLSAIRKAV